MYHRFVKLIFGLRIRDTDCDFRLIRNDVLRRVHLGHTTGVICVELVRIMSAAQPASMTDASAPSAITIDRLVPSMGPPPMSCRQSRDPAAHLRLTDSRAARQGSGTPGQWSNHI